MVEVMLKSHGGIYSKAADWQAYVITDSILVKVQNPASSEVGAETLLKLLS